MRNKLLQDRDGSLSSKRVMGYILTGIGICEKLCLFCNGLNKDLTNFVNLDNSANTLIQVGGLLLGVCVFEFLKKDGNKSSSN